MTDESYIEDILVDTSDVSDLLNLALESPPNQSADSKKIKGVKYIYASSKFNSLNPGTGQIIAVLDTGIDPGADGLCVTMSGKPKLLDIVDCTRGGDIDTSTKNIVMNIDNNIEIRGHSDRLIKLDEEVFKPGDYVNIGSTLLSNIINKKRGIIDELKGFDKKIKHIIVDVVTKKCGNTFRSYVCMGDLFEGMVEDYAINQKYYSIAYCDRKINFGVKYYDSCNVTSFVFESGSHGTHVAGIIAANFPNRPEKNGIAPDAQLVSLKIGDSRIKGLETTRSLIRAMNEIVDRDIHIVNLSFGEPVNECMTGELISMIDKYCKKHNIIFVSSAGNDGPGLMTVGAPSACTSSIISVGAYVNHQMLRDMYFINYNGFDEGIYHWSARGPTVDGDYGVTVVAPGGATTSVSCWSESSISLANGTSMASPYVCGCLARVFSTIGHIPYFYWVKRHLMNTAKSLTFDSGYGLGSGMIQPDKLLEEICNTENNNYGYNVECEYNYKKHRGIFMRTIGDKDTMLSVTICINVFYKDKPDRYFEKVMDIYTDDSIHGIITAPNTVLVTNSTAKVIILINLQSVSADYHGNIYLKERDKKYVAMSVPVNIMIPDNTIRANKPVHTTVKLQPGYPIRTTIIPKGPNINIDIKKFTQNTKFYVTIQQMLPGMSYRSQGIKKYIDSTTKGNSIKIKVCPNNLTEICFVQNITDHMQCNVDYTLTVYNSPHLPKNVLNNDGIITAYIELPEVNAVFETNLSSVTSPLYPHSHSIVECKDQMVRTDRFSEIKKPIYQLINNYIIPKGCGEYLFNIPFNNDIYESTLVEAGFVTLYKHNTPIIFSRHYDETINIRDVNHATVMFMGTSETILKSLVNTPILFKKTINIPIGIYRSRSDCINNKNVINMIKSNDTYFFRPIFDNTLTYKIFDSYTFQGKLLGEDIYVVRGKNNESVHIENKKNTLQPHDSEFINKISEYVKQLNPKTVKDVHLANYEYILIMWETSSDFNNSENENYYRYLMLNALGSAAHYKKKLQKMNVDKKYPYFLIYHDDYEMRPEYIKLVKDNFDKFQEDSGYSEKDMCDLVIDSKKKGKREYMRYMFNVKQTVF